jgi:hypothetical protein
VPDRLDDREGGCVPYSNGLQMLGDGFIPRMNGRSRSGIMIALGSPDLFTDEELRVHSIIVDARLASDDQDVSAELRNHEITMIVDTQAWRYSDPRTWETAWGATPYAPSKPFSACQKWLHECVRNDLAAQFAMGSSCLLLPGWFPSLETSERASEVARWTLQAYEEFKRKVALVPAIAWLPSKPGSEDATLAAAKVYAESGIVRAAYVQRNKVNGVHDPLDRLKRSVSLMARVQGLGIPVIAGHFGPIGLTIRAMGVAAADCGPCEGHSFDYAESIRSALPRINESTSSGSAILPIRIWVQEIGQVVTSRQMATIRSNKAAFAEVMCRRSCHRFRLGRDSMAVAVHHSLLSLCETAGRQFLLPKSMRVDNARRALMSMKSRIGVIERTLEAEGGQLLQQDHLDAQLALLAGAASVTGVA